MEVVNDVIVQRDIDLRNALNAVVADTSDNDISLRCNAPDERDISCENAVPCINDIFGYDFVQRLESNAVSAVLKSCGDLGPEPEESVLQSAVVEELFLISFLHRIESISVCFVKIDKHLEAVLNAPLIAICKMSKTSLLNVAVFVL